MGGIETGGDPFGTRLAGGVGVSPETGGRERFAVGEGAGALVAGERVGTNVGI